MTPERLREIAKSISTGLLAPFARELRAHADELERLEMRAALGALQGEDTAQSVCNDLPLMRDRCMKVGLYATGQLVHDAIRKSGYELAELLERSNAR